jgi:hypothetical protein
MRQWGTKRMVSSRDANLLSCHPEPRRRRRILARALPATQGDQLLLPTARGFSGESSMSVSRARSRDQRSDGEWRAGVPACYRRASSPDRMSCARHRQKQPPGWKPVVSRQGRLLSIGERQIVEVRSSGRNLDIGTFARRSKFFECSSSKYARMRRCAERLLGGRFARSHARGYFEVLRRLRGSG